MHADDGFDETTITQVRELDAIMVRVRTPGDAEGLELVHRSVRGPQGSEVRVRVRAAGVNRADIMQRRGVYPAPRGVVPDILGLEYAGEIEAVGDSVMTAKVGDRVMGIVAGGAMSSSLLVHERELIPVPTRMTWEQAAAIPEVFMTAWDALFSQAELRPGMTVLVHAVGSGVGTAALQIATHLGCRVIGTSRTESKLQRCEALGLKDGLLVEKGEFAARVNMLTDGQGADVILDGVGAAYLEENLRSLALRGTLVVLGLLAGSSGTLPLGALLAKRATVRGSVLRSRPLEEKIALARKFRREALPLFIQGALQPVIERVFPVEKVADAHRLLESNETFGKVIVSF
jgi:putative PIG3 family NAD(P)H quinone oxidoreductase